MLALDAYLFGVRDVKVGDAVVKAFAVIELPVHEVDVGLIRQRIHRPDIADKLPVIRVPVPMFTWHRNGMRPSY